MRKIVTQRVGFQHIGLLALVFAGLGWGLSGLVSSQEQLPPPRTVPSLKELLPPLKPLEPEEALKSFRIEKGFRIELIAAEPQVVDPIAMAFDENGLLYVAEDIDYPDRAKPVEKALGRVRLLSDPDGKGGYRKSTIFADKLHWPSGIVPWKGGIFVGAPPQIVYLKDTDGDGKADVREVVYEGFGVHSGEDIMNNIKLGIDNWIYGGSSYNGGDVRSPNDPKAKPISVRGRDFRFHPTSREFQGLAGTGDFGNCFDDWGNRFVANPGGLLVHPVLPGQYLHRNPFLTPGNNMHKASASKRLVTSISPPEPWRVVRKQFWQRFVNTTPEMRASRFPDAELAEHGYVTGGAGNEIYRGTLFPPDYRGNSFTAEPACNVVIRLVVKPNGLTFDATPVSDQQEFLASTDNWFRPVNVLNGPDGALYILDMYREVIEDPSAIPDEILKFVDVTRGRDRGRIYRIVPDGFKQPAIPQLGKATMAELVAALEHSDSWWRETAQRLLVERQDNVVVPALQKTATQNKNPLARLHSLWTLHGLKQLDEATLLRALDDEHLGVRENAIRLCEGRLAASPTVRERLLKLAADEQIRIRLQTAFTLGEISQQVETIAALAAILTRDIDDPWMPTAVLSSVGDNPLGLLNQLLRDTDLLKKPAARALLNKLAGMIAARKKQPELIALLRSLTKSPLSESKETQQGLLLGVADTLANSGQSLLPIIEQGGADLTPVRSLIDTLIAGAIRTVKTEDVAVAPRVAAIRLLRHASYAEAAPSLKEMLTASQPLEVQVAAIQAIAAQTHPQVAALLLGQWRGVSPRAQTELLEGIFRGDERLPPLLEAIEKRTLTVAQLPPDRRVALLKHRDEAIRSRAEKLFATVPIGSRKAVLEKYQEALKLEGDAPRGADLFLKHCAACHSLEKKGKTVGPDLNAVQNRAPDALLLAILDPNRDVASNYMNYIVRTTTGRTLTGIIAGETDATVILRRAEGAEDVVLRRDIDEIISSGQSLMPEGIEQQINIQQMADLLRYLNSLRK